MNRLLVEIGTEEIPAGYIQPALASFSSGLEKKLAECRITHGTLQTYGTPRRLTVVVDDVADKQTALAVEMTGPPARVALDQDGRPTVPGIRFAEKVGVPPSALKVVTTEKGEYVCAVKTERGLTTKAILRQMLPEVILGISFPKTMRWADQSIYFTRPIHSIAALLGKQVVSFFVGNVKSGRQTFGHRFMAPKKIRLSDPDPYLSLLAEAFVLADIKERQKVLVEQMERAVTAVGGQVIPDAELVDTVTHLVEYPAVAVGRFDEAFLCLPREILITAMRVHQKYFAVVDGKDNLLPYFVAVNNTRPRDMDLVVRGHERVLRARLADARFFVDADLKTTLDEKQKKLAAVLFQAELGSMAAKTDRIEAIARYLAGRLVLEDTRTRWILRAARLCKADLVSHAVVEFPKLQGIMGRVYALAQNEPEAVAAAIEEHYRPAWAGAPLPDSLEGAVVSIADKIDSICGCFAIGLIPTGASDPYGLRRQANGIVLTALARQFPFSLESLVDETLTLFPQAAAATADSAALAGNVTAFLKNRMAHLLEEEGIARDVVAAVLAVSRDNVTTIWEKARSLQQLKTQPDFDVLAIAFKRVVNIIKKADASETVTREVNPALFEHPSESLLFDTFKTISQKVRDHVDAGDAGRIDQAFHEIASMREIVDRFFEDVMVMADDMAIRRNRLALLGQISGLFALLADFSRIST